MKLVPPGIAHHQQLRPRVLRLHRPNFVVSPPKLLQKDIPEVEHLSHQRLESATHVVVAALKLDQRPESNSVKGRE